MPKYYTVKESAKILDFSTNSIYKFVNIGRLKSSRGNSIKGRFRITHKSLESFLGTELTENHVHSLLDKTPRKPAYSRSIVKEPEIVEPATFQPPIPINVTRGLIILSLLFILADIFISRDFSPLQQLIRFCLLAIIILITYQFGSIPQHDEAH